jgi:Spy/CpxP family protein refolding chaperone
MKRLFLAAIALQVTALLALSASVGANDQQSGKPTHRKWWQTEEIKTQLGLTAQQSTQLEEIFQATVPKLRAAKEDLDRRETGLSQVLADPAASESQVSHHIDKVESARAELSKLRTLMLFRMHRLLSPEQRDKLKAVEQKSRGHEKRPPTEHRF